MSHAWLISCFICIVLLDAVGCSQADQDNVIVRPDAEGPRGMIRQAGPWLVRVSGGPQNATLILSFEDSRPNAILLGGQMNQGGREGGADDVNEGGVDGGR